MSNTCAVRQHSLQYLCARPSPRLSEVSHQVLWGNLFFPCTRHVSMYLRPGIVILSFVLSHGVLFLLVSSAIDVATVDGIHAKWVSRSRCGRVQLSVRTCDGYVHTCTVSVQIQTWACPIECPYVRWLQQMEHTHRGCVETCMLGETPSTPWLVGTVFLQFAVYSALNSCT